MLLKKWFESLRQGVRDLWYLDPKGEEILINDVAVRIRAGLLLAIPLYMALTLYDAIWGSRWIVTGNVIKDTFDTDFDGRILYMVEAVRRTWEYSTQTKVLFYGLFEMLAGMFVITSRLSPTVLIASLLARGQEPVWKPLTPKRFAWSIGATFITLCLIFFNPDTFAGWVNTLFHSNVLPTTENFLSPLIPLTLVWVCLGFMWLEAVLGFCVGCKIHALMARLGWVRGECYACNNIHLRY